MLKLQIIFLLAGIVTAIFAHSCETTTKSPHNKDSLERKLAEAFSDIGSSTLCLVRLSCDPEITKSIYRAIDRCVQRTRELPSCVSNEEYLQRKYPSLLQAIEELKSINPHCRKIPYPCNNKCRGKPLDAPSEVIDMGKSLAVLAPLVKCLLAQKDSAVRNTLETIIVDGIKRVAASDPNAATSVGLVKKQFEDIVNSLRGLHEKCNKIKAVNGKCICECISYGHECDCGCRSHHDEQLD